MCYELVGKEVTCKILHLWEWQLSSTQGWYIPKVMQLSKMTIIDTLSNHLSLVKEKSIAGVAESRNNFVSVPVA